MLRRLLNLLTVLSAPGLSLVPGAGCYSFKPVTVHVIDAETGTPVDRATVCITHRRQDPLQLPAPGGKCVVASNGTARISAELHYGPIVKASARGYLPGAADVFESVPRPRGGLVRRIELYRQPHPAVVVTLPAGYRGVVKIGFRMPQFENGKVVPSEKYRVGQRLFPIPLESPATVTWFDTSPLISRAMEQNCYVVFDDGTPLPITRWADPQDIAFRQIEWSKSIRGKGQVYLFFVGPVSEYAKLVESAAKRGSYPDEQWLDQFGTSLSDKKQ